MVFVVLNWMFPAEVMDASEVRSEAFQVRVLGVPSARVKSSLTTLTILSVVAIPGHGDIGGGGRAVDHRKLQDEVVQNAVHLLRDRRCSAYHGVPPLILGSRARVWSTPYSKPWP